MKFSEVVEHASTLLQRVREAFALAQKLSHPFSIAFALNFALTLHQFRKERQFA